MLFLSLVLALTGSSLHAQHQFGFFLEDEVDYLAATLELRILPATHEDVVGLTFIQSDGAPLGFGTRYSGTFDETVDGFTGQETQFVLSEQGGLDSGSGGLAIFRDLDPPDVLINLGAVGVPLGSEILSVELHADALDSFRERSDTGSSEWDRMLVNYRAPDGFEGRWGAEGYWRPIPEPAASWLAISVLCVISFALRRRRRRI